MGKYETIGDDQVIKIIPGEFYNIACCDCCLVHDWTFELQYDKEKDEIYIIGSCDRNERSTAQLRRHEGGELQNANESKWIMLRKK